MQDGNRFRKGAEIYWAFGPVCLKGEYMHMSMEGLTLNNETRDVFFEGGYTSLLYNITGETFEYKNGKPQRIIPKRNLTPDSFGLGAIQIGVRYEFVKADNDLIKYNFVDASKYTDKIQTITFGVNWYLNEMVRLLFNYYYSFFDDHIKVNNTLLDHENVFLCRFQIVF